MVETFREKGWAVFPPEPALMDWAAYAHRDALRALADPTLAHWYQCENTWFVGLDALQNDPAGRVAGSKPLTGAAVDFVATHCGGWPTLHLGQISGVFPGYPRPRTGESDAAFRYRCKRDAAHVDGVIGEGTPKRRFVREPHAFILGVPLTHADAEAAPLVVWEGSHKILRDTFCRAFEGIAPELLPDCDVTDVYQTARTKVFNTCRRVIVHGPPGSAYVIHRLALHGVAPWVTGAQSDKEGRLIAYFRPPMTGGVLPWATNP